MALQIHLEETPNNPFRSLSGKDQKPTPKNQLVKLTFGIWCFNLNRLNNEYYDNCNN
jgi:hypothetical protein